MSWVLHHHPATSTPLLLLSLIHHVRVDASSITVGTRLVARTAAVARKTLAWPLAGPRRRHTGGGKTRRRSRRLRSSRRWRTGVARGPVASREKRTYPTDTPSPRPARLYIASDPPRGSFQSQPGLYPAKAATAPVIGIIIEFLPTGPHQTARGETRHGPPDAAERHELAQLRPVDRLHAHRLEFRRVRAPHHPQHHVGPDLRLLDERQ